MSEKLTGLVEETNLDNTDLFYIVTDVNGTPTSKAISKSNLSKVAGILAYKGIAEEGLNLADWTAANSSGTLDLIYLNTDSGVFEWYDRGASEWREAGSGGGGSIPVSKTGTNIVFTEDAYYNELSPLTSGNLTLNLTNAVKGNTVICHCNGYNPSINGVFKYKTDTLTTVNTYNVLKFEYDGFRVFLTVYNIGYLENPSGVVLEPISEQITLSSYGVLNSTSYEIIFNEELGSYVDNASLIADQVTQTANKWYSITTNGTIYEYLGTTNGNISDYLEITILETGSAVTIPSYNGIDLSYEHTGLNNDLTYVYFIKAKADGFFDSEFSVFKSSPSDASGLIFDKAFDETISLTTTKVFAGEFNLEFNVSFSAEDTGYAPIFNHSNNNRIIISDTNATLLMSIGGSNLSSAFSYQLDTLYKINVYRDVSNDVYVKIDENPATLMGNATTPLSISNIGRGTSTRRLTGYIKNFTLGDAFYGLTEGEGTALTASNGDTATYNSTGDTAHINNVSWSGAGTILANRVFNEGISGNNSDQIKSRIPTLINQGYTTAVLMVGTNDCLNSDGYIDTVTFKTNVKSIVSSLVADGQGVVILSVLPAVDSYLKSRHDYTPIYGDESTFNVNDKILLYNNKLDEIVTEDSTGFIDTNLIFANNGEPSELIGSWIRNVANSGVEDGIHPTVTGLYQIGENVKNYLIANSYDTTRVACIGDSITVGVGVVGSGTTDGNTYPAVLKNLLNQ